MSEHAIRLELPFPPSNHDVFKRHNGKHMSARYRKWRDDAGFILKAQRPGVFDGTASILIELVAPDKRRRDCDNYTKGPIDLLVKHGVIPSDDMFIVREVITRWVDAGVPCSVTISEAL